MRAWKPGSMVSIASRPEVPHITRTFSRCSCAMVTTDPLYPTLLLPPTTTTRARDELSTMWTSDGRRWPRLVLPLQGGQGAARVGG